MPFDSTRVPHGFPAPLRLWGLSAAREVPDVALEVVKTHAAIDELDVYRGLGVREVWVFEDGTFSLFGLRGHSYEPIDASDVLPEVHLSRLAYHAAEWDQHAALKAHRDELRGG